MVSGQHSLFVFSKSCHPRDELETQMTVPCLWQAVPQTPLNKLNVMQPDVTSSNLLISVICSKYLTKTFGNCLTSQEQQFQMAGRTARKQRRLPSPGLPGCDLLAKLEAYISAETHPSQSKHRFSTRVKPYAGIRTLIKSSESKSSCIQLT